MGKDVTAKPGRYSVMTAPYQREPQEAFTDTTVQTTVLWWASRLGKTEIMNNLDGWVIDNSPMGILVVYPTIDSAKKWSKEFFAPMIRSTPRLRGKIRDTRSKDANNTILSKQFPGGKISAIGANSPSGFRQIQAPVVKCDEIDAMEDTVEGDPIELAFKRADNYPDSIQVLSSTGTVKGSSRIEAWYDESDKRKWFCPCPRCGQYQLLKWSQVRWEFPNEGKLESRPEDAVYVCEHCHGELSDYERVSMVVAGEWRATAPFSGIRGYWINGINSTFPAKKGFKSKLHQFVTEFLQAKRKGPAALRVWINTFLAETYEEAGEVVEADPLYERRETYGPDLPVSVLLITAGLDVQRDRIEGEKVGWGIGEESWGLETKVFVGNPAKEAIWREVDAWLLESHKHPSGAELRACAACIDSGDQTKYVYDFCRPRQSRKVYAVKGSSGYGMPLVSRPRKSGVRKVTLYFVGTDTAKEIIYSRLKIEEPGPGFMHFARRDCYDMEYFKQLTAEKAVTKFVKGQRITTFVKRRPRNEALDYRVYATAAYALRPQIPLERLAKELAVTDKPSEEQKSEAEEQKPEPKPPAPSFVRSGTIARRGGWVKGWMK